ncbi:myomegalin-like [Astyanax mexicanus]|uniref:Myomegalin-like n=1 Tax=Astyanax mexicanus TaxID=7994 RepID=A0A8T2M590_ASTMX|nr:myomegalin-like [Astyanax mexicanus]
MSNTYRTLSQHLNDLKKENFSLKLRIYFLEERIQQKYEDNSEDVYRTVSRPGGTWEMQFFCM